MKKILFFLFPQYGHLLPVIPIIDELTSRGATVAVACTTTYQKLFTKHQVTFIPLVDNTILHYLSLRYSHGFTTNIYNNFILGMYMLAMKNEYSDNPSFRSAINNALNP